MRLLKATAKALVFISGMIATSKAMTFLAKSLDLDFVDVINIIVFVGALAFFTAIFYISSDKKK